MSIFAPCILPILPGLVVGYEKENKYRPILLALGITITFTIMGIISSAFGHLLGQNMYYIEKIGGGIILLLGIWKVQLIGENQLMQIINQIE